MCLEHRSKRDEAREEGRGDREGGTILIPEQEEAMGGLRQGVRASIYILRRAAEELVSALTRSRLLIKAGSRVKSPAGSSRNCAEGPAGSSRNCAEVHQGRGQGSLPLHPGGRH